ncbi:response regulator [Undibacterium sp. LX40W]|uniref:Response regulator n=1 Tax=Undibacterium nitidum TaxID=2762298 RepID=A0A923HWT7_9BURK|nr:response regulator [Undibacterium nitidum]MBC3892983.1 response regulator [Undibacterium sp. LX40W]
MQIAIVDDERPARDKLCRLLHEHWPDAHLYQAADGNAALQLLAEHKIDLIFLDIQMPEIDGLEVAQALNAPVPAIIFVTAYDQFALQAFDANAIDYLLKPYDEARFLKAINKVRSRHAPSTSNDDAPLLIGDRGSVKVVQIKDIVWAEAADNYVMIHTRDQQYMMRQTLSGLAQRLGSAFARCHRRYLVRVDQIAESRALLKGDAELVLHCGVELPCSRQYREGLKQQLSSS